MKKNDCSNLMVKAVVRMVYLSVDGYFNISNIQVPWSRSNSV